MFEHSNDARSAAEPHDMHRPPLTAVQASRLVERLLPHTLRRHLMDAIRAGRLREIESVELLAEERLPSLARRSAWLLAASLLGFAALDIAATLVQRPGPLLGATSPALQIGALLAGNIVGYIVILPAHEALHAATILALGGRPSFGLKLPIAAYCTAPGQLFTRNGYIAVTLTPLVVLTVSGIAATWFAPHLAAYLVFALAGNISGAVGDLEAVASLRRLPPTALIADTQTGYTAYLAEE